MTAKLVGGREPETGVIYSGCDMCGKRDGAGCDSVVHVKEIDFLCLFG